MSNINFEPPADDQTYGPDMFYSDLDLPDPSTVTVRPIDKAWTEGGVIENVKRAVVTGLRDAFRASSIAPLKGEENEFYIDIEYPTKPTQFPGIWVQFTIESLNRAGIAMETEVHDDDLGWGTIHAWSFNGRITITAAATTSKDRDRLADTIIAQLSFSRPPDLVLRDPQRDTKQFRGLITTLDENPFVMMTLNTDVVQSSGQTVTNNVPWAKNMLLYEDNYSITCHGQYNIRFNHDGTYTLAEIRINPSLMGSQQPYNPTQWRGRTPSF